MKKKLYFIFFLWPCITAGQITINPQLLDQLKDSQPILLKKGDNQIIDAKKKISETDNNVIYEVSTDHFSKKLKNFKKISADGFERYIALVKTKRNTILQEHAMRELAMKDVKSFLPKEISDSCAVTSVGFDYMKKNDETPQIVGSTVFFHRILDGTPVRGGAYIQIEYDSSGTLEQLDIYWPKYRRKNVQSFLSKNNQMAMHEKRLKEQVNIVNQDILDQGISVKGELKKSYKTLKSWASETGEIYLIPNMTYVGSFNTEIGEQALIIDVPLDESLIPQEKIFVYQNNGDYR